MRTPGWSTTPASPSTAPPRSGSPGSTRAPWARWPTARSGSRSMPLPIRRAARSTGGCSCPRAGMPMPSGGRPVMCPSRFGIDPSGSWPWTWWTSLAAGAAPAGGGHRRRLWGVGRAAPGAGGARAGLRGPGQGHHQRLPRGGRPQVATYPGRGRRPRPRYRTKRSSLAELVLAAGVSAVKTVAWREGTRGKLRSRFVALRVRPAGVKLRRAVAGGELPVRWLLAEWPADQPQPVKYWLASLPEDTPLQELVRLAKLRWRVEMVFPQLTKGWMGAVG